MFLYFQSQLLLRLCLIILYNKPMGITYIQSKLNALHAGLRLKIQHLESPLECMEFKQTILQTKVVNANNGIGLDSSLLARLKRSSSDIACRLLALAREFQTIGGHIQSLQDNDLMNRQTFENIMGELSLCEEALVANMEDYRRMKLIFSKFMITNFNIRQENTTPNAEVDAEEEGGQSETSKKGKTADNVSGSDFFALCDSDERSSSASEEDFERKKYQIEDELQEFDFKTARSSFAPVLRQLKSKIDPLKVAMKERELTFLMAKGFDRERILNAEETDCNVNNCRLDSKDSSHTLSKNNQRKYDEMRDFMQSKQQLTLLLPPIMPISTGEEEILE